MMTYVGICPDVMVFWTSLFMWLLGLTEAYVISKMVFYEPKDMFCWTCSSKGENGSCFSRKEPSRACPKNYTVCQTVHKMNTLTGLSMSIHKRCALPIECSTEMVGCHGTNRRGIQACISCCNFANCNKPSSPNQTPQVNYQHIVSSRASGPSPVTSAWMPLLYTAWLLGSDWHRKHVRRIVTSLLLGFTLLSRLLGSTQSSGLVGVFA